MPLQSSPLLLHSRSAAKRSIVLASTSVSDADDIDDVANGREGVRKLSLSRFS